MIVRFSLRSFLFIVSFSSANSQTADSSFVYLSSYVQNEARDSLLLLDTANVQSASSIRYDRLAVMGGITLGTMAGSYFYIKDFWWEKQQSTFHFEKTAELYALHLDKVSHFWGGTAEADLFGAGFRWSGIDEEHSIIYGALMSNVISFSVEMTDAYAREHGFSIKDFGAGALGAWYRYLQYKVPALKAVNFKLSYWNHVPRYFELKEQLIEQNPARLFVDNYGNQTYWMVINARSVVPHSWKQSVPPWLGVALGVRAGNVVDVIQKDKQFKEFQVYLSLDIDVAQFFPETSGFWSVARRIVSYIHLPAPALRITPKAVFFGFYF